ncbi:MAG: molecular chaperone HtpG [Hyphomicrobiaceae bacterium]|nr:molecular chaperone HtpG [Hyphomicrobiaceae bacterium]
MNETIKSTSSERPFQAEVSQLLKLMINSVYSETEIFLRELLSNASDACDKLRYEAISAPELLGETGLPCIRVTPNHSSSTLMISDTGIGMSHDELVENLGTIAHSGTKAFIDQLQEVKDGNGLIGQFGVGFYSAFMVADRINVISRRAGNSTAWMWTSTGDTGFKIVPADEEKARSVTRGTEITLFLKPDAKKYAETDTVKRIVQLYSDHVQFPIKLVDKEGECQQINSASAIWQRPRSELKNNDYEEAYRAITHAIDKPALTIHFKAEGRQLFAVLLFVPTQRPFNLFNQDRKGHVKLYVRRVYITSDAELLPPYLRFVSGVVDSEDLPLNISREMLQKNLNVAAIRSTLAGRVLSELERLAEETPDTFNKVWDSFGPVIKEGIYEDHERRERILKLSRFVSTKPDNIRSLKQYLEDMRPNQTEIYYLVGNNIDNLRSNPVLEAARARGIEVLFFTDHVDAFWTTIQADYEGKPFKSLSHGDINFDLVPMLNEKEEKEDRSNDVDDAVVIAAVKNFLGDRVSDVRVSKRLINSPVCLIASHTAPDRRLEKILASSDQSPSTAPILELNMTHDIVHAIADARALGKEAVAEDLAYFLFEQAQILDGEIPADPTAYAQRLNRLVLQGLQT